MSKPEDNPNLSHVQDESQDRLVNSKTQFSEILKNSQRHVYYETSQKNSRNFSKLLCEFCLRVILVAERTTLRIFSQKIISIILKMYLSQETCQKLGKYLRLWASLPFSLPHVPTAKLILLLGNLGVLANRDPARWHLVCLVLQQLFCQMFHQFLWPVLLQLVTIAPSSPSFAPEFVRRQLLPFYVLCVQQSTSQCRH